MYILATCAFRAVTNSNRYARYRRMAEFYEIEIQTTSAALKDEREDELRPGPTTVWRQPERKTQRRRCVAQA